MHRDVKPSNILLDEDDFAYLIDFGIARGIDQTGLTGTGAMIGSWHYMSPERLQAGQVDARSDIYALACVLYECLTGRRPYPGDNLEQQITAHLTAPPPRPSSTDPMVPMALDIVIATGMAKRPDQRYPTTVELAHAARDAITTPVPRPAAPLAGPPPPRPRAVAPPAPVPAPEPIAARQTPPPQPRAVTTRAAPQPRPPATLNRPVRQHDSISGLATPARRTGWRRKTVVIPIAVVAALVVALVAVVVTVNSNPGPAESTPTAQPPTTTRPATATTTPGNPGPEQTVLPFTGLNYPDGVAVDAAGSVYVADKGNNQVLLLAAGSSTQTVLPFTGLDKPYCVAVDAAGSVYVIDYLTRVVMLPAGSSTQTVLPFTGLSWVLGLGLAVDPGGNVYVADQGNSRVVKLAAGSSTPTELPGLDGAKDVAVDAAGNVYVVTYDRRVVKLAAGSSIPTDLLAGLDITDGMAVDAVGNVYFTELLKYQVVKLAAGSNTQTVLPFTGLSGPHGVAVDAAGNVYVTDNNNRVVKLPAS